MFAPRTTPESCPSYRTYPFCYPGEPAHAPLATTLPTTNTQTHTHTHTQIDCVTRHRRSYSSRRGRRAASLTLHPSIPVTRYSLAAFFPLVSPAYPREHSKLPKYLTYVSTGASTLHRSNLSFSTRLSTSRVSVFRPYLIQMSIHIIKDHTYILFSYVLD